MRVIVIDGHHSARLHTGAFAPLIQTSKDFSDLRIGTFVRKADHTLTIHIDLLDFHNQNSLAPFGTLLFGVANTTSAGARSNPVTSTSDLKPAMRFGSKLRTAITCMPGSSSNV